MHSLPIVAAFDFDGTLTYRDTFIPFLNFVKGRFLTLAYLTLSLPALIPCLFKNSEGRQLAKESLLKQFFKNMPREQIEAYGKQFAEKKLPGLLRPEALKCLRWHQKQGHRCILVSANLDIYLNPWAKMMGFQEIITSQVASLNGLITGKLIGNNVWGPEKERLLRELLGPKENFVLYAYGDSLGDKELLALADKPFYRQFHHESLSSN